MHLFFFTAPIFRSFTCLLLLLMALPSSAQQPLEYLEWQDQCPFGTIRLDGRKIECGLLTVLEDRNKPTGPSIKLAVLRIKSTSESPQADPVIYLSGGPGAGALRGVRNWLKSPILKDRDLILYDQRGTGFSEPSACQFLKQELIDVIFKDLSSEEEVLARVDIIQQCPEELAAKGIDPRKYNSEESARDMEVLRQALGYEQWNLYGISYGTRLAQFYMRQYPKAVRSVILDSVVPTNVSYYHDNTANFAGALTTLFDQCEVNPKCKARFPNLENDFYGFMKELEQEPFLFLIPDSVYMNAQDFALLIHQSLYSHQSIPFLPMLIEQMKARNKDAAAAIITTMSRRAASFSYWMMYSVNNYDGGAINTLAGFEKGAANYPKLLGGLSIFKADAKLFDQWKASQGDSIIYAPVVSDIPTLIFSGGFDPITPSHYGEQVQQHLSNSYHFVFPSLGHGSSLSDNCPRDILLQFLAQPNKRPEANSCIAEMPPTSFITDSWINGGVYSFATEILRSNSLSTKLLPTLAIFFLFTAFAFYPMYSLIQRLRKQRVNSSKHAKLYKWFGWLIATLGLIYAATLLWSIALTGSRIPVMLAFGLPESVSFLQFMPWIVGCGGVFILLFSTWLWKVQRWNRPMRIHFIILGISASYLGALAIFYGLF